MNRRVLLVEDEDDIREVAALSLEAVQSWSVVAVGNGVDGVAAAVADPPDVVLLDVMMPGQDGPSTLAALRADPRTRDVPVVFLTAKTQRREQDELLALGAAGVLAKPFDPVTLGAQIAAVLGWSA